VTRTTRFLWLAGLLGSAAAFAQSGRAPAGVTVRESADALVIANGRAQIAIARRDGVASYAWNGSVRVRGASSAVKLDRIVESREYPEHAVPASAAAPISDGFGKGVKVTVVHRGGGRPDLRQNYYVYEGKPYFFVDAALESRTPVATNWFAPLAVSAPGAIDIGRVTDGRVLFVPWDNDHFIRYRSDPLDGQGTSYETTAIFDNTSRNALVVGSITHDTWKTGIDYRGSNGKLDLLTVYGGASSKVTQDNMPHGKVSGTTVLSPRIFVGYFEDWRDGMEEFGAANRIVAPPLPWKGEAPLGWNSWAAYGCRITPGTMMGVSDFLRNDLRDRGYGKDAAVYVNWDSACSSPLAFKGEEYEATARHIKANGQHPGIYFSSFAVWGWAKDVDGPVMGTDAKYRWSDILLRDAEDRYITIDGGRALDPTHPGTRMYIEYVLKSFRQWGYEFVKLDFLSHGAVEGRHHLRDMTAMQAYNYGMKYIREAAGDMFISLSIAPLFPGAEYAHARRISCDAFGKLKDTEYMLNSLTYGWWLAKYYRYNDGDHVVVGSNTRQEAQSRFTASAIAGLVLDSDKLAGDAAAQARAREVLARPAVAALARKGASFRPVEGNSEDRAGDLFVLEDGRERYMAVFNYQPGPVARQIDLVRAGFGAGSYRMEDLWSEAATAVQGSAPVSLDGSSATVLRLTRVADGRQRSPKK
jgi:alpha-galactosidase